jgi:hypothetical protein
MSEERVTRVLRVLKQPKGYYAKKVLDYQYECGVCGVKVKKYARHEKTEKHRRKVEDKEKQRLGGVGTAMEMTRVTDVLVSPVGSAIEMDSTGTLTSGVEDDRGRGSLTKGLGCDWVWDAGLESGADEGQGSVPETFRDDIDETLERPIPIRRPHDDAEKYPSLDTESVQRQALPEGSVQDPSKKNVMGSLPALKKCGRGKEYERFLNKHTQDLGAIVTHYRIQDEAVNLLLGVFHAFLEDLQTFQDQRPELPKNRSQLQSVMNVTMDRVVSQHSFPFDS